MPFQIRSTGINAGLPHVSKPNNPFASTGSGFSLAGVDTGGAVGDDFPFELAITYDATAKTLNFEEKKLLVDNNNATPIAKLIRECLNLYTIQVSQNGQVLSGFIALDSFKDKDGNFFPARTLVLNTTSFNNSAPVSLTVHIGFNPSYLDSAERIRYNFTRSFPSLSAMSGQTIEHDPDEAIGELFFIIDGVEYADNSTLTLPDIAVGEQVIIEPTFTVKTGHIAITQIYSDSNTEIKLLTPINFCLHLKEGQSTFKGLVQYSITAESVGAKGGRIIIYNNQNTFVLDLSYNVV